MRKFILFICAQHSTFSEIKHRKLYCSINFHRRANTLKHKHGKNSTRKNVCTIFPNLQYSQGLHWLMYAELTSIVIQEIFQLDNFHSKVFASINFRSWRRDMKIFVLIIFTTVLFKLNVFCY